MKLRDQTATQQQWQSDQQQDLGISSFPPEWAVVPPVVSKSTATDRVDNYEEDKDDDVEDDNLLPFVLDVGDDAGFARSAVVAENRLVVAPGTAVGIA